MSSSDRPVLQTSDLVGLTRDPLVDGRQSDKALAIQRGVCRMFMDMGLSPFSEFTLATGRRADVIAISDKGDIWIVEIKSSLADFRSDSKWHEYLDYCDRFLFAVDADFPVEVLPDDVGYMMADRYGAEIVRPPTESRLITARRKAVTVRFAWQLARRMQLILDPEAAL